MSRLVLACSTVTGACIILAKVCSTPWPRGYAVCQTMLWWCFNWAQRLGSEALRGDQRDRRQAEQRRLWAMSNASRLKLKNGLASKRNGSASLAKQAGLSRCVDGSLSIATSHSVQNTQHSISPQPCATASHCIVPPSPAQRRYTANAGLGYRPHPGKPSPEPCGGRSEARRGSNPVPTAGGGSMLGGTGQQGERALPVSA